ncbi:hypothetical protein V6N11_031723 [Hibiscus sabdariffa]|uniref:Uncharacterized protein n=1 Tax=Hibiscus sabdariffa TaxID=183260 RepID=A0ABR2SYI5_9ROSI
MVKTRRSSNLQLGTSGPTSEYGGNWLQSAQANAAEVVLTSDSSPNCLNPKPYQPPLTVLSPSLSSNQKPNESHDQTNYRTRSQCLTVLTMTNNLTPPPKPMIAPVIHLRKKYY